MTELAALSRGPLWITGGEQRSLGALTPEWKSFRKAVVVKVDGARTTRVLEYISPPQHCPDDTPCIVFKAATIAGADAYLCTQTEVLVCNFPSFSIRRVISHPCFNDVHHVAVAPDGRLFVAVTGLDAIAELSPDGNLLRLTSLVDDSPWTHFSPEVDYRKHATTKPYRSHPNYVFFLDGEPWVTRFEQRDAVPLYGSRGIRRAFRVAEEGIHDGVLVGDQLYFTAVDGRIIRFGVDSGCRTDFDLNLMRGDDGDHETQLPDSSPTPNSFQHQAFANQSPSAAQPSHAAPPNLPKSVTCPLANELVYKRLTVADFIPVMFGGFHASPESV